MLGPGNRTVTTHSPVVRMSAADCEHEGNISVLSTKEREHRIFRGRMTREQAHGFHPSHFMTQVSKLGQGAVFLFQEDGALGVCEGSA